MSSSSMACDVVVVGDVLVDIFIDLPYLPKPESAIVPKKIRRYVGGNGNFIVMASRLGLKIKVVDSIGNDFNGKFIKETFLRERVDISGLVVREGLSRECLVLIHQGTKSFISLFNNEKTFLYPDMIREDLINAKAIYISGYSLLNILNNYEKDAVYKAFKIAKNKGLAILFDASPLVNHIPKPLLHRIIGSADIIFLNLDELKKITSIDLLEKALEILGDFSQGIIVVKMGEKGALAYDHGSKIHINAFKSHTVDPTGAGDAFNAAFTYGYLKKIDIKNTLKLANAVGALTVRRFGGGENLPSKSDILNFLRNYDLSLFNTINTIY